MKKIFFLFVFGISKQMYSQKIDLSHEIEDYIRKSTPQAMQFQKYGDLPISANTGKANISIPFFSLGIKNVNWDIGINYNTGGFKVAELASCAGLGWNVSGSGMISARIYQRCDVFLENSANDTAYRRTLNVWPTYDPMVSNPCAYGADIGVAQYIDYLKSNDPLMMNFLPDIFYLNAGNLNEQFILLKDTGYCLPSRDLSIIHTPGLYVNNNSYPGSWIVIDESGTKYTFEAKGGSATNFSSASTDFPDTSFATPNAFSGYNPVFALTQIENVFGEKINLYYTTQCHQYRLPDQDEYRDYTGGGQCNYTIDGFFGPSHRVGGTEVCDPRLDSISTTNGQVAFFYYSSRSDLIGTSKLDSVSLFSRSTGTTIPIKTFALYNSYFGSGSVRNLRLRLDSLAELNTSGIPKEKYYFGYNSDILPSRISPAQDSSGYYNGETSNTNLVPYYGGNRTTSFTHTKACVLESIQYPTGGFTLLEYEMKGAGRGLRIKRIKDSLDATTVNLKEYIYNSGYTTYVNPILWTKDMMEYEYVCSGHNPKVPIFCGYTATYSDPVVTLADSYYGDQVERYSWVTEYYGTNGINGKVEYFYADPNYLLYQGMVGNREYFQSKFIFKKVGNDYIGIKGEGKEYLVPYSGGGLFSDPENSRVKKTWGLDFDKERDAFETSGTECGGPEGSLCYPARYFQVAIRLVSAPVFVNSESYGDHGPTITKSYKYLNFEKRLSPTSIITKDSKGNYQIEESKYPIDYFSSITGTDTLSVGIINLRNKHVLIPVEKYVYLRNSDSTNERLVSATFTSFRKEYPAPYRLYSMPLTTPITDFSPSYNSGIGIVIDSRYKERILFNSYTIKGTLLEQQKVNDLKYSYLRMPINDVPLAVVTNADSSSIAFTSFEIDKGGWTYSGSPYSGLSVTGSNSYGMSGGNITKTGLPNITYIVSYWGNGGSASVNSTSPTKTGRATSYWTYYEHEVTGTSITVSGSNYIDELRLYPKGAQMITYTYSPELLMTGQCDVNNRMTFYEYDNFNRLKIIRDEDGNIIKRVDYKYLAGNGE